MKDNISHWNQIISDYNPSERIKFVLSKAEGKKVFSTSFGIEDQVVTDLLCKTSDLSYQIFTLDTGRLFQETYNTFERTEKKYAIKIKTFLPNEKDIQEYVSSVGINGFYTSVDNRKRCCYIRKVIPLQRALKGAFVWITGLRSEQSQNRNDLKILEWDEQYQLVKFNPIIDMSLKKVEKYADENKVPINPLYKKGYLSIGCAPCTRAVEIGEDFRAGRWWWEQSHKECGLHESFEK